MSASFLVPPPVRAAKRSQPPFFHVERRRASPAAWKCAIITWVTGHPIVAAVYDRMLAGLEKAGLAQRRADLLAAAHGRVIELGAGTGANLAAYPDRIDSLTLIEPDPHMARRLRAKLAARQPGFDHELLELGAERLPFEDRTFDTAVATLVLCTIPDPERALVEVARVLKPDGSLLVIEHVRDPDSARRARWQDRLERPWGWLAGGCHPNRDTRATLRAAGFDVAGIESDRFPKGGPVPLICGSARVAQATAASSDA
jgi:SAM-dependent methyltransferase